jgi:hypothetical protein
LKPWIDFNTEKRKKAKNDFEKDYFKLMNNIFDKTMEGAGREGGREGWRELVVHYTYVSIHTMYIKDRERDRERGSPGSQREGRSAFEFNLLLIKLFGTCSTSQMYNCSLTSWVSNS